MRLIVDIKDNKAAFFMELIKNFSFVKTKKVESNKQKILNDLRESVKQVKLHKQGKIKLKSFDEFLDEL